MARRISTVAGRLIALLLVIHAVSLPLLIMALDRVASRSLTDTFMDEARIYGRAFADTLEIIVPFAGDEEIIATLDSAVLGGQGVYAAIVSSEGELVSSVVDVQDTPPFQEDFGFGQNGDDVYFLSMPFQFGNGSASLRLGVSELSILENLSTAKQNSTVILSVYVVLVLVAAAVLSTMIARPLRALQRDSRRIASGDYEREIGTDSSLVEIRDLSSDLEAMRSKLVGINARLQSEITEREHAEAERRELESKLRHAQRLEALGTLAGGVAHEFNNVLQPISMYTELVLEDLPANSDSADLLERVQKLAGRARNLCQQILTFGHRSGDTPLAAHAVAPLVEEALTMIAALLPATVELRANIDHDVAEVRCNPAQIQQLLVNLCNNAARAIDETNGAIDVSLYEEAVDEALGQRVRAGRYVVLEVSDTGVGMDSKTLARIFEPFFTTGRVGQGTGLGMSVVHGIVARHDGEIIIDSEPGKGTKIRVYLPVPEV